MLDAKPSRFITIAIITMSVFVINFIFQGLLDRPALAASVATNKLKVGDSVVVASYSLNIRALPGYKAKLLGTHLKNDQGKIVAGPRRATGLTWWQVNFNTGVDGWVAEKYLTLAVTTAVNQSTSSISGISANLSSNSGPAPVVTAPVVTAPVVTAPVVTAPVAWGAYVGGGSSDLANFEALVGKQVNMQATFVGWGDDFPTALAAKLKSSRKSLVIFWEQYGTTLDAIIAGNSDSYIMNFAAAAEASGATVILAPLHEMNGNWDPWDGTVGNNTPTKVINAWRRIHGEFAGVSNVKFAWDVNNVSVPNTAANAISQYYPGDAYVDYVAVDGFNFGSDSWNQVFPSSLINQLSSYNKPVYILSTASVPGTQKAQWIKDMGAQLKNYPSIVGWVWFNQNGADGNWLVNSDSASLAAFKSILP